MVQLPKAEMYSVPLSEWGIQLDSTSSNRYFSVLLDRCSTAIFGVLCQSLFLNAKDPSSTVGLKSKTACCISIQQLMQDGQILLLQHISFSSCRPS